MNTQILGILIFLGLFNGYTSGRNAAAWLVLTNTHPIAIRMNKSSAAATSKVQVSGFPCKVAQVATRIVPA